jgi:hypothetical protein
VSCVAAFALAASGFLATTPSMAESAADTPVSDLKIQLDEEALLKVFNSLPRRIGAGYTDRLVANDSDPICKAAAVLVAAQASDNNAYWKNLVHTAVQLVKSLELFGQLTGQATVTKVAAIVRAVVESSETDDPYGNIGKLLVDETVDWVGGKVPKSGNETIDEQKKRIVDSIQKKLTDSFFPNISKNMETTYPTTVGACDARVTVDPADMNDSRRPGIRIIVAGDCHGGPVTLPDGATGWLGFGNPRGQTDQIKNSHLRTFQLSGFLPLQRLDSDVRFNGKPVNIKKLWKTLSDLRKALSGSDNSLDQMELSNDLQDQIGKAATFTTEIVFTPVYSNGIDVIGLTADCGQGSSATEPQAAQPPPPPNPCDRVNEGRREAEEKWERSPPGVQSRSDLKRVDEEEQIASQKAMFSKDPDEQKNQKEILEIYKTQRLRLEQEKRAQIRKLFDMASQDQTWTAEQKACYLTQIDLEGEWTGTGKWDCNSITSQQLLFSQTGKTIVATKITGDDAVPKDEVHFRGTYDSNPFTVDIQSAKAGHVGGAPMQLRKGRVYQA